MSDMDDIMKWFMQSTGYVYVVRVVDEPLREEPAVKAPCAPMPMPELPDNDALDAWI